MAYLFRLRRKTSQPAASPVTNVVSPKGEKMDQPDIASAASALGWIELVKRIGGFMVIAGVAIEVAGDWLGTPLHKKVDDARELHVAQLEKETADARERTAKLERATAPRALSQQEMREKSEALKKAPPVQYTLGLGPIEIGSSFLSQLIQALRDGGWTLVSVDADNLAKGPLDRVMTMLSRLPIREPTSPLYVTTASNISGVRFFVAVNPGLGPTGIGPAQAASVASDFLNAHGIASALVGTDPRTTKAGYNVHIALGSKN